MNTDIFSFEYYSTIAPVSCAFFTDDPHQCDTEMMYDLFPTDCSESAYLAYPYNSVIAYKILK